MSDQDAELEKQAQAMAEKALAALPEGARALKIAKVKEGILKRLKAQAASAPSPAVGSAAPSLPTAGMAVAPPPPGPPPSGAGFPPPPPAPPDNEPGLPSKQPGIEVLGDEPWFADLTTRRALRQKVIDAHAAQKILVGAPAGEIKRICPGEGRVLGAGAVLRLGGSTLGGYGEADVAYAYRQLSRALHPDKNPDVPEAHDAFKRLSEAADELRQGLEEARNVLKSICLTMGGTVTAEMLERPQEALFAEAMRMLQAVLSLAGEGDVPGPALSRSLAAFTASTAWLQCRPQVLLSEWFDQNRLLDLFASAPLRTAYDCAPKRFRAQFLCALNRATLAEAKRHHDCVRGNWHSVLLQFPEIALWRDLREKIRVRVWAIDAKEAGPRSRKGSMWDDEEGKKTSSWATTWRERIRNILPRGIDAAVPSTDPEVRLLSAALWKDLAEWAKGDGDAERHLNLFTAEATIVDGVEVPPVDEWAFVPAADLLLVVGEGIVGISADGLGAADAKPGHERMTFAEAILDKKKKEDGDEKDKKGDREKDKDKDKDRSRDRSRGKGKERDSQGRLKNDPDFNWEEVWKQRVQLNKRRPRSPVRERSESRGRRRGGGGGRTRRRSRERSRERSRGGRSRGDRSRERSRDRRKRSFTGSRSRS